MLVDNGIVLVLLEFFRIPEGICPGTGLVGRWFSLELSEIVEDLPVEWFVLFLSDLLFNLSVMSKRTLFLVDLDGDRFDALSDGFVGAV